MNTAASLKNITPGQIRKIHALKNVLHIEEEHYRALLLRWEVESSKEMTMNEAKELIDFLVEIQRKRMTRQPQLLGKHDRITKKQFNNMVSLWAVVSRNKDYDSLRAFVRKTTRSWYLWLECMDRVEAGHVIAILKAWKDKS